MTDDNSADDSGSADDGTGDNRLGPDLSDRLAFATSANGFAYVPDQMIVRAPADERNSINERFGVVEEEPLAENLDIVRMRFAEDDGDDQAVDVLAIVELLAAEGAAAQPEHVLFAHTACGDECRPHPADLYAALSAPTWAHPYRANPYRANPYRANPYRANPYRANPNRANGPPMSTAVPVPGRELPQRTLKGPGRLPRVLVLDSGLAGTDGHQNLRPAMLQAAVSAAGAMRVDGALDVPDQSIVGRQQKIYQADGYLDPVAGHGTFIAGLVEQLAPGCTIQVDRVLQPLGDVREGDVIKAIERAVRPPDGGGRRYDIISMSFGGHLSPLAFALRQLVARARQAGCVVVASAGNDGSCVPSFPAAFDNVVAVGAIGPDGPAPWSNYGSWVDACAPGVDLVSSFFATFNGALPLVNGVDPDHFQQWARWSGTSFAVPFVVAALAREMVSGDCDAAEAAKRVIHAPHLMRIPYLGTVVNA